MLLGLGIMSLLFNLCRHTSLYKEDRFFGKLQLFSSAIFWMGHGMNDAKKTMGINAVILFSNGFLDSFTIPLWVEVVCYTVIGLGTMAGGWRIVKTMGTRITKLRTMGGFSAEAAAAGAIIGASLGGIPVSTTHTVTGAIVGVGATHRLTAVHWGVAGTIVWAWVLTIPLSALISALIYTLLILF
jgi:PiT family inorganic phosphate transporter